MPTLAVVLVVQVVQRWMHFAVANPARQVFYTVLDREEKYKAKNLIDVVIYRGSDALYGWVFDSLQTLGLKLGAIALVAAPVSAVWLILSVALGRAQERRAKLMEAGAGTGESEMTKLTRREFAILPQFGRRQRRPAFAQPSTPLITRAIPASGEPLPAVGLGTAQVFDSANEGTRQKASAVVQALIGNGGKLIDTASTYGDAERVLGDTIAPAGLRNKLFIATKLESPDAAELKRSLSRLKTEKLDLLQLHNVRDPQQSLSAFKEWKAQGVCRYIGITSTFHGAFSAVETVLTREKPDFVQIDYSIEDREAEKRILPLAGDNSPGCSPRCRSAAAGCSAPCAARRFPIGLPRSPEAGRNFFSNIC